MKITLSLFAFLTILLTTVLVFRARKEIPLIVLAAAWGYLLHESIFSPFVGQLFHLHR